MIHIFGTRFLDFILHEFLDDRLFVTQQVWSLKCRRCLITLKSSSQEDILSSFADRKPLYLSLFGCSGINFETSISELQGEKGTLFSL